jgi:hypothetical protein
MAILGTITYQNKNRAKALKGVWLVLAIALLTTGVGLPQPSTTSPEYQVKAVFLFNFTQFVEWPANAFPEEQTPLVIGVLGDDPFGSYLDETVQGEKVNGHPLIVRRFYDAADINTCHILFITGAAKEKLKQTLEDLKGRSVLTVSDVTDFTRQGGMVRFFNENNKIRIRINLEATRSANLTISSKLLRLAEVVGSK